MGWPDQDLREIIEHFRQSVLPDNLPNNTCFALSYPLSILLKLDNDVILTGGLCGGTDGKKLSHFWIKNGQDSELIIDPTASQFLGLPEINYKLDHAFYSEECINWLDLYDDWAYPLKNDGLKRPHRLAPNDKQFTPDFDRILLTNIRAANYLYQVFKTNNIPVVTWRDHLYFDCIWKCLNRLKQHNLKTEIQALPETCFLMKEFGIK
ncbi:MAG: hypothetical protein ACXVNO_03050 [Bacteroidia bacterium]